MNGRIKPSGRRHDLNKPIIPVPAAAAPSTQLNFRWHVLIWLLIGGIINYMDRASLSIAAPGMIQELGLTRTQIGLLGSVFA